MQNYQPNAIKLTACYSLEEQTDYMVSQPSFCPWHATLLSMHVCVCVYALKYEMHVYVRS